MVPRRRPLFQRASTPCRSVANVTTFRWLSTPIAATVIVAWLGVLADGAYRGGWDGVSKGSHYAAALVLYTASGTLLGLFAGLSVLGYRAIARRAAARSLSLARWTLPVAGAIAGVVVMSGLAFWLFSGERVRATKLAAWGPWALLALSAAIGAGGARTAVRLWMRVSRASAAVNALAAATLFAIACGLVRIDLTYYVALYLRLHTLLEATAGVLGAIAFSLLIRAFRRRAAGVESLARAIAAASSAVTALFVLVEPVRTWVGESLRHAWREPVYAGRMLSRVQIVEGFVRDPRGWRGATMSSVVRLREKYDIATTTRSPIWDAPPREPDWLQKRLVELRGGRERNVIVYYVDTLRADVANDARVMPATARFAKQAIDFRNAYTTGSDTLHALPGITGGSYDLFARQPNDVFHVARAAGYHSVLFVAQSAHEFLGKMLPEFRFDESQEVSDYARGNENVWGYGADQPTAGRLVDRTLDWLRQRREQRFLLWMFNFDLHNWRELDDAYVKAARKRDNVVDENDAAWRYKIVAHSVDAQFERLVQGLADLGLADDTVLLFISDHGEGLGRDGFWVHSVFLWEDLIHVPLMLRVPGIDPAVVRDVVSLVDVAPTLARFMAPEVEPTGYHGEDLLACLVPGRPRRRLPLVLMATLKEVPVRLGLIDPAGPWKLVLPLEGAVPELYDRRAADPDLLDVSGDHGPELLHMLNDLVRTPLFPRLTEVGSKGSLDQAAQDGRADLEKEARERK